MVSKKLTVKNESGLHARPAGILAQAAMKCNSDVWILIGDKKVQVKSILNLMAAGIKCGTEIELQCEGESEAEDLKGLVELIESGLGE
ncbi:MAG: HPr family phosphocarrier protein [Lachnospiraceae bacterium]|jgi:phosphocarrier protein HPr|nr:HPr family phosphocarrier protein [Lachnospiraceae bacterium]